MATNVPFKLIQLSENDVPGAVLPINRVEDNNVDSLVRFLICRGVKPGNKRKADLSNLVIDVKKRNLPIDQSVDGGKWLQRKADRLRAVDVNVAAATCSTSEYDIIPVTGWKKFPSSPIPTAFDHGSIYVHVVASAVMVVESDEICSDKEENTSLSYGTNKSFKRGQRYFMDGHVSELEDTVSKNGHYCLKANTQASMRKEFYKVLVMLHQTTGQVLDASCGCKASGMSRCSHICALLLTLENFTLEHGFTPPACTSVLCTWNQGRKEKSSAPIYERKYTGSMDPSRVIRSRLCDPGCSSKNSNELKYLFEVENEESMWGTLLSYKYDDYDLSPSRASLLKQLSDNLREALLVGATSPQSIPGTEQQASSNFWKRVRSLMITASSFPRFLSDTVSDFRKLEEMWWPTSFTNQYVRYGIEHENLARLEYIRITGNEVADTGLWVNPAYPGLGASPDGIVTEQNLNRGTLEIKCPFTLRNNHPTDLNALSPSQQSAFCLKKTDATTFMLKRGHKYFKQIQMQLGITGLEWCDFVLWTSKGMYIERIYADDSYWAPVAAALLHFHRNILCPEYFEQRVPRQLSPFKLN